MPLFSTYSDLPDFLANSSPSQDTASLVGGNTTLSVGCAQGATSLTVGSVANFASSGSFPAFILDGASSEVVTASVSGASLSVPAGTLAAHGAGASVSSAGTAGCLADLIATASAMVETKCKQGAAGLDRSLWQQSRVEKLSGPTLRAAFDVDHSLVLRPFHFPVASVTSISVQMGAAISANLDTTYLFIPDGAKTLVIPWAQVLGTPPLGVSWIGGGPFPRNYGFVATLTYTAGPCPGTTLSSVPYPIKEATRLLVLDRLGFRRNPLGAASVRQGDVQQEMRLRGDTTGRSLLEIRADELLDPYVQKF